ncbi:uncharacterized protein BDR25DRAFT_362656 [Lindgomyces ingoldianus]|uniref:Uncharacterized protein n=1 Tax=Lindgomyces ingoldianus TaxID=673940 RepID=A0ACB6Q9M0_9PLEO|nr:uncharacterized protein BDR25DRAFT_362656 [Lindgomyces ingoldianus]KAF2463668.1 hypothetical protein BDR25DRAFT_362656 [Lindgomyces ingoldianus]
MTTKQYDNNMPIHFSWIGVSHASGWHGQEVERHSTRARETIEPVAFMYCSLRVAQVEEDVVYFFAGLELAIRFKKLNEYRQITPSRSKYFRHCHTIFDITLSFSSNYCSSLGNTMLYFLVLSAGLLTVASRRSLQLSYNHCPHALFHALDTNATTSRKVLVRTVKPFAFTSISARRNSCPRLPAMPLTQSHFHQARKHRVDQNNCLDFSRRWDSGFDVDCEFGLRVRLGTARSLVSYYLAAGFLLITELQNIKVRMLTMKPGLHRIDIDILTNMSPNRRIPAYNQIENYNLPLRNSIVALFTTNSCWHLNRDSPSFEIISAFFELLTRLHSFFLFSYHPCPEPKPKLQTLSYSNSSPKYAATLPPKSLLRFLGGIIQEINQRGCGTGVALIENFLERRGYLPLIHMQDMRAEMVLEEESGKRDLERKLEIEVKSELETEMEVLDLSELDFDDGFLFIGDGGSAWYDNDKNGFEPWALREVGEVERST